MVGFWKSWPIRFVFNRRRGRALCRFPVGILCGLENRSDGPRQDTELSLGWPALAEFFCWPGPYVGLVTTRALGSGTPLWFLEQAPLYLEPVQDSSLANLWITG
jgi:hypothetical protein